MLVKNINIMEYLPIFKRYSWKFVEYYNELLFLRNKLVGKIISFR